MGKIIHRFLQMATMTCKETRRYTDKPTNKDQEGENCKLAIIDANDAWFNINMENQFLQMFQEETARNIFIRPQTNAKHSFLFAHFVPKVT